MDTEDLYEVTEFMSRRSKPYYLQYDYSYYINAWIDHVIEILLVKTYKLLYSCLIVMSFLSKRTYKSQIHCSSFLSFYSANQL